MHFSLASQSKLPMFLHNRSSHKDFIEIVERNVHLIPRLPTGELAAVVHSFTGSSSEAQELVQLGFFIGINGCSMKTMDNLEVVKNIPLERLMVETDAPWCEIKQTHAGFSLVSQQNDFSSVKKEKWNENSLVKGRNEPCMISKVADIIAAIKCVDVQVVIDFARNNSIRCFGLSDP